MVRPGRNGWVAGDLSWARLEALRLGRGYREPHLRLLRELYGLYQASNDLGGYGYRYGQDRWMEFSAIGSRQLWPLLDEAAAAGLSLVHPGRDDGPAGYGEAGFCLDVTRGEDGGLQIVPVVRNGAGDAGRRPCSSGPRATAWSASTVTRPPTATRPSGRSGCSG